MISVSISGLSELRDKLSSYKNSMQSKQKELLQRLAEIGVKTADIRFQSAVYDGVNDVQVSSPQWISDDTVVVSAGGNSVMFIEFGTGVVYPDDHPKASNLGMIRGSYGQGKGKQTTWGYYGEGGTNGRLVRSSDKGDVYITHGNPANRSMYEASKEIEQNILRIVKEVYKFD